MLDPADEGAHRGQEECWSFDFVSADGLLAGYARLALLPATRRAWWWAAVVGRDRPFVLVREHDIDPPKLPSLEIRAAGLWAEPYCEAPFEHWSVGLEAFAVALDDPLDAFRGERGDPVPLGLDLGWEADEEPVWRGQAGYTQPCAVHGEVLVGRERIPVAGAGTRLHEWGPPRWADDAEVDERGLITSPQPLYHAPIQLPDGRLARAVCQVAAADGRPELAWRERFQPAPTTRADT